MPDPTWNTPARLDGLRPKNWKKRAEVTRDGTLAEMFEIWLGLPHHEQQNCSLGWGPTEESHHGTMSASTMARYAQRNGLPPQMATRYHNAAAALARMLQVPISENRPYTAEHFADGSGTGQQRDKAK